MTNGLDDASWQQLEELEHYGGNLLGLMRTVTEHYGSAVAI